MANHNKCSLSKETNVELNQHTWPAKKFNYVEMPEDEGQLLKKFNQI